MAEKFYAKPMTLDKNVVSIAFESPEEAEHFAQVYRRFNGNLVELWLDDGRTVTGSQRKFAMSLLGDIDDYTNGDRAYTKGYYYSYFEFVAEVDEFSLSRRTGTMDLANKFIDFLIGVIVREGIPMKVQILSHLDPPEIGKYEYAAVMSRRCEICGQPADIAHVDTVGAGRNRDTINHIGKRVMALCRVHHSEQHNMGVKSFMEKHHLYGVKLTADMVAHLKLGRVDTNDR